MNKSQACIDASIIVSFLTAEETSIIAEALWVELIESDVQVVAPLLLRYEVVSAIYRKTVRGFIAMEDAQTVIQSFMQMSIEYVDSPQLSLRALELAARFKRPNTYDAHYLALSEHLNCPYWTSDERLYNAIHTDFPLIHRLGQSR